MLAQGIIALFALVAPLASALPVPEAAKLGRPRPPTRPPHNFAPACPVTGTPDFPAGQTALSIPSGQTAFAVGVGQGVQNYTCTAGAWVSAGAVATLYDASCLSSNGATLAAAPAQAQKAGSVPAPAKNNVLGHHYFVNAVLPGAANGTTTLSPKFDFTPAGQPDNVEANFQVVKKIAPLDAANKAVDVPWLQLGSVDGTGLGTLAKTVYRVDTAGGQPPSSCSTEGDKLSVKYAANYWFFK